MAYPVPTYTPNEVRIGTSWHWDVSYPGFSASDGWQLRLYFRGPTDLNVAWGTGITANGSGFSVRITPALAAALTVPGAYRLFATVTLDGEVHEVESRHVLVLANSTAAVGAKSFARKMLEAIDEALIAGVASSTETKRLTVNGRTVEYRDAAELERRRSHYAMLVAVEENPYGSVVHVGVYGRG